MYFAILTLQDSETGKASTIVSYFNPPAGREISRGEIYEHLHEKVVAQSGRERGSFVTVFFSVELDSVKGQ